MRTIIMPEMYMFWVARSSRQQRKTLMNLAPRIGLSVVDYSELHKIDQFYVDCQNFRDYYRDLDNKLHRPQSFPPHCGKCVRRATIAENNTTLLSLPDTRVRQEQPIVYVQPRDRHMHFDGKMELGGHYEANLCAKYKR